jgi:hypothetical protein
MMDFLTNPPTMPACLDSLDLAALKSMRDKLRIKVMVLLLTTPAAAARPETWQWLGERFSAQRGSQGGDEEAVLASINGLLDVVAGLSMGEQSKAAAAVA